MTVAYATISGQFLDVVGDAFPTTYSKNIQVGHIEAATANGLLTAAGKVLFKRRPIMLDALGNATVTLPKVPQADVSPTNPYYKMVIPMRRNQPAVEITFQITTDMTWDQVMASAVGNVSPEASLVAQMNALIAQMDSFVRPASKLTVFGHSYTTSGATDSSYLFQNRLAAMMGVPAAGLVMNGLTGSQLITGNPVTNCGYANIIRNSLPLGTRALADEVVSPLVGPVVMMYGRNDAGDLITATGTETTTAVQAWKNALRVAFNGINAGVLIESEDTSVVTLGGSGSWASFAATTQNTGTLYKENPTTGATATVAIPAGFKGGVVGLAFVSNRLGGTVKAGPVTFTVDGVATAPIGYPSGFTTLAQNPTASSAGNIIARFNLSPGAHTIVATSAGGGTGCSFDRVVMEADTPRPILIANIAHVPPAGSTPTMDAAMDLMNTALDEVVLEFSSSMITVVDIDSILNADPALFHSDNTHPNDEGHARIAKAFAQAWTQMTLQSSQLAYV